MTLTPAQLEELENKAKAATPGPWTNAEHIGVVETGYQPECCESDECCIIAELNYSGRCCAAIQEEHDTAHIAAANPSTVLALVEEVKRLREAEENWCEPVRKFLTAESNEVKALREENAILKSGYEEASRIAHASLKRECELRAAAQDAAKALRYYSMVHESLEQGQIISGQPARDALAKLKEVGIGGGERP